MHDTSLFLVSAGPMLAGSVAMSMAIFQYWFFLRNRRYVWIGWGSLVCLAASLYNIFIFFDFHAESQTSLAVLLRLMHTSLLLLYYALANFIYSFLSRGTPQGHRLFALSMLAWLALLWFTPFILPDHLANRASLWLGGYYPRPCLKPLGLVLLAYYGLIIVRLFMIWPWSQRKSFSRFPYLTIGMAFWAVLGVHDILASMFGPARIFLGEYGVLGFCFSMAGLTITGFQSMEQSLLQAQKTEALSRLASGIAHDFNNLLTVISLNTELLMAVPDQNVHNRGGLERIMDATKRGGGLVRGLLSLGRQASAQGRPLDLNQEITRAAKLLGPVLPSSTTLELRLEPGLPAVTSDPAQIEQILLNLGINARDAMPRGGKLTLSTSLCRLEGKATRPTPQLKPGDYVLLTVADSGQGMDKDTLRQAFDPFFTTKHASKGSGLGLATIQTIMESRGGAITCASAPGQGAAFSLYWPASDQPSPDASAADGAAQPGQGAALLLVDDEISFLEALRESLSGDGYRVLTAQGGEEAVAKFSSDPVRLVVMDLHMPGMSPQDCLKRLRKIDPQVKVIVVTADLARAEEMLPRGGNVLAHLGKPVLIQQLRNLIGVAFHRQKARPV